MKDFEIEIAEQSKPDTSLFLHLAQHSVGPGKARLIAELPGVVQVKVAPYRLRVSKARVYDWREIVVPVLDILGLPVPAEYVENAGGILPQCPPFTPTGKDVSVTWQVTNEREAKI